MNDIPNWLTFAADIFIAVMIFYFETRAGRTEEIETRETLTQELIIAQNSLSAAIIKAENAASDAEKAANRARGIATATISAVRELDETIKKYRH